MNLGWQLRVGITTEDCIPGAPPQAGLEREGPSAPLSSRARDVGPDHRAHCSSRCLQSYLLAGAQSPLTASGEKKVSIFISFFLKILFPYTVE